MATIIRCSLPQQIATALLKGLQSGVLNSGDRLPSVRELERYYCASCSTILAALGILEQRGAIVRQHGLGRLRCHHDVAAGRAYAHRDHATEPRSGGWLRLPTLCRGRAVSWLLRCPAPCAHSPAR